MSTERRGMGGSTPPSVQRHKTRGENDRGTEREKKTERDKQRESRKKENLHTHAHTHSKTDTHRLIQEPP